MSMQACYPTVLRVATAAPSLPDPSPHEGRARQCICAKLRSGSCVRLRESAEVLDIVWETLRRDGPELRDFLSPEHTMQEASPISNSSPGGN